MLTLSKKNFSFTAFRSRERTRAPCFLKVPAYGQLLTRFAALTVPIPVAKSHPVVVPYAFR
jgi:hypothetical protein